MAFAITKGEVSALEVVSVHPSGEAIPENLLRLSIVFSTPPEGAILPKISLERADGTSIEEPFLKQELWSPDVRRLTLHLHPARVKSGLVAHKTLGRALEAGSLVSLCLGGKEIKRWTIESPTQGPLQLAQWQLSSVKLHTREKLIVQFDRPIDIGGKGRIAIADAHDKKFEGKIELRVGEKEWSFTPIEPWENQVYRLVVHPGLEDAAGNTLATAFERSVLENQELKKVSGRIAHQYTLLVPIFP